MYRGTFVVLPAPYHVSDPPRHFTPSIYPPRFGPKLTPLLNSLVNYLQPLFGHPWDVWFKNRKSGKLITLWRLNPTFGHP